MFETGEKPYRLARRQAFGSRTVVTVGAVHIGGPEPVIIGGPCSVESREQIRESAHAVKVAGAHLLRGGAFKPRTSPYHFQGLGIEGLHLLAAAGQEVDLPVITEVMEPGEVETVAHFADILQIGSRNMHNTPLLQAAARNSRQRPILLKRGFAATIDEWLCAAEYILVAGNPNVILCERGVRGFDARYTRNLLDLACVPLLHELTHLPIVVDPSHGTGQRLLILAMARAAVACGADGLMIEMHPRPDAALSDAAQTLDAQTFAALCREVRSLHTTLERLQEEAVCTSR
jgi:3-deoxy-7-phosphoheptulonate synthase